MVERIRHSAPRPCADAAWRPLVRAMNGNTAQVVVPLANADEVLACHQRATGDRPQLALPSLRAHGRAAYEVDRAELFAFVQQHGKVCGHEH